jgi:hypothetical protein
MKVPFSRTGFLWTLGRVALLLSLVATAYGNAGNATPTPLQEALASSQVSTPHFTIADFDGDSQPDLATVQTGESETRYWIRFQLSTGSRTAVGLSGPAGGLEIASRDVNGDEILDLVVTTAWLKQPVAVLLNDGHGNFTLNSPSAFSTTIWGAENSEALGSASVNDAAVAALWRCLGGDCDGRRRIPSARQLSRLLVSLDSEASTFSAAASALGRAPPTFVHNA